MDHCLGLKINGMWDALWIIFNILLWILLSISVIGLIFWLIKKTRWEFVAIVVLMVIIIIPNITEPLSGERIIQARGEIYEDVIRLNVFQKEHVFIYSANNSIQYRSSLSGIVAGIYWNDIAFSGEPAENDKIRYTIETRKRYYIFNIPLFSKSLTFEGTADKTEP